jgi:hypothetical protein
MQSCQSLNDREFVAVRAPRLAVQLSPERRVVPAEETGELRLAASRSPLSMPQMARNSARVMSLVNI